MKIAVSIQEDETVCGHLGRAGRFFVYETADGQPLTRETRTVTPLHPPEGHVGPHAHGSHETLVQALADCGAVLTGGMGNGMVRTLYRAGIAPVITTETRPEVAVQAWLAGQLEPATVGTGCLCGCSKSA